MRYLSPLYQQIQLIIAGRIGGACARTLALNGTHLALTYSSSKEKIDTLIKEIRHTTKSLRISSHKVDMASVEDIKNLFAEIQEQHGAPVDILVSNAGYGKRITDVS